MQLQSSETAPKVQKQAAFLPRIPFFEPVEQSILVEGGGCCHVAARELDVGYGVC